MITPDKENTFCAYLSSTYTMNWKGFVLVVKGPFIHVLTVASVCNVRTYVCTYMYQVL